MFIVNLYLLEMITALNNPVTETKEQKPHSLIFELFGEGVQQIGELLKKRYKECKCFGWNTCINIEITFTKRGESIDFRQLLGDSMMGVLVKVISLGDCKLAPKCCAGACNLRHFPKNAEPWQFPENLNEAFAGCVKFSALQQLELPFIRTTYDSKTGNYINDFILPVPTQAETRYPITVDANVYDNIPGICTNLTAIIHGYVSGTMVVLIFDERTSLYDLGRQLKKTIQDSKLIKWDSRRSEPTKLSIPCNIIGKVLNLRKLLGHMLRDLIQVISIGTCRVAPRCFYNATSLVSVPEEMCLPDCCAGMFYGCGVLKINRMSFDTSHVTNMSYMFADCRYLAPQELIFDTRNVTNMAKMFLGCTRLGGCVFPGWNTENVTDMSGMFQECSSFSQPVSFSTRNVVNITDMFTRSKSHLINQTEKKICDHV